MSWGVLDEVPPNTPVTLCIRMVLFRKHYGDQRRTVDLHPINNMFERQSHHTLLPLKQAYTVTHNTLKSTNDAWNRFHNLKFWDYLKVVFRNIIILNPNKFKF